MRKQLLYLQSMLEEALKGRVKKVFLGKPKDINIAPLPCVYITVLSDTARKADSHSDLHDATIAVGVCLPKALKSSSSKDSLLLEFMDFFEGTDEIGDIKTDSIFGAFRAFRSARNVPRGISLYMQDSSVDYDSIVNIENEKVAVREAQFTLTYYDDITGLNAGSQVILPQTTSIENIIFEVGSVPMGLYIGNRVKYKDNPLYFYTEGTNAQEAFNDAIAYGMANNIRRIYLEPIIYDFSEKLSFPIDPNMTFVGSSLGRFSNFGTTIRRQSGELFPTLIEFFGKDFATQNADLNHTVIFENISFDGNGFSDQVIHLRNYDIVEFHRCRIVAGKVGILAEFNGTYSSNAAPGGLFLRNVRMGNTVNNLYLKESTQIRLETLWLTSTATEGHIRLDSVDKLHSTMLEFNPNAKAIVLEDNLKECRMLTFSDVIFDRNDKIIEENRGNDPLSGLLYVDGIAISGEIDQLVGEFGLNLVKRNVVDNN